MQQIGLVEIVGSIVVIGYIVWLILFFQLVRPWLMQRLSKGMGVQIRESLDALDAGTYSPVGAAPLATHAGVTLLDIAVLLLGTVGVCALISIPGFLIGESGAPYRWESVLTQTQVRMDDVQLSPMHAGKSSARVRVVNEGKQSQRNCQIRTAEYAARNGYLTGSSPFFDLTPAQTRDVEFELSAIRPAPGRYDLHLSLECQYRLKDKIPATIQVVE